MLLKLRTLLISVFLLVLGATFTQAQVVTTDPLFPTADEEVTLIFDVSLANDGRAQGLLGLNSDVFLWSGAGSSYVEGDGAFEFGPSGQTDFNAPFEPGRMTFLGNDRWSITLTPRSYYGVPAETPIEVLGVLLKNGNGNAQTENFYVRIYDGAFNVAFTSPVDQEILVDPGEAIEIEAGFSTPADADLYVGGNLETSVSDATSLSYTLTAANSGRVEVEVRADNGQDQAEASFFYVVKESPTVEAVPSGIQDGVNYTSNTSVTLALTAPQKELVFVIGEFNNWQFDPAFRMKEDPSGERFWLEISGLNPGQEYSFQYVVFDANDNQVRIADPFSEKTLDSFNDQFIPASVYPNLKEYPTGKTDGFVSVLQTAQTPYNWQVNNFQKPKKEDLVIYELLVRDFESPESFQKVIDRLDYLADMGINAIEFMPIMEFSGNDSWGYNPIFFTAVDKAYGTANKLKELIDACHARGIAVILDMVLNHADFENPYVKMYFENGNPSANSPYFNVEATHPFSVFYDFNHESQYTKDFMDQVNRYWIEEFRFDGYRFDLSKGFTQVQNTDVGAWSARDQSRINILKRMADEIWEVDSEVYIILEHFADNSEERELAEYVSPSGGSGMMFWGNMHGSFKENVLGFSNNSDIRGAYAGNLNNGGGRGWTRPENLVSFMESHDEQRLMYDALNSGGNASGYNVRNLATALDRVKTAAAFLFSIPGPKMFWQFGELGYEVDINENGRTGRKPIRWEYFEDENRKRLYDTFSELIKLKTTYDIFETSDVSILGGSSSQKQITLTPTPFTSTPSNANEMSVHILGNFGLSPVSVNANFQHTGTWYEYFSGSADAPLSVNDQNMAITLQPGEFRMYTNYPLAAPELELHNYTRPKPASSVSAEALSDIEIRLSWTDDSKVESGYKILRSISSGGSFTEIDQVPAGASNYTDRNGLSPETTYYYKVVSFNNSGENSSGEVNASTEATISTPPAAPSNLSAQLTGGGDIISLIWTDNATNETRYLVERKIGASGNYTVIANLNVNVSSYLDDNVSLDQEYFYRVGAAIGSAVAYSNEVSLTVLSVENNAFSRSIRLYPNPGREIFLEFGNIPQGLETRLLSAGGDLVTELEREVLQEGKVRLDFSKLPSGIYFLEIRTKKGRAVKRVLIP